VQVYGMIETTGVSPNFPQQIMTPQGLGRTSCDQPVNRTRGSSCASSMSMDVIVLLARSVNCGHARRKT